MDDAGLGLGARHPLVSGGCVGGTCFWIVTKVWVVLSGFVGFVGWFEVIGISCGFRVVFFSLVEGWLT